MYYTCHNPMQAFVDRVTDFVDLGDAEQVKALDDFLCASTDSQKLAKLMQLSLVLLSNRRPATPSDASQPSDRPSGSKQLSALLRRHGPNSGCSEALRMDNVTGLEAQRDANVQLASDCRRLERESGRTNRHQIELRAKLMAARLDGLRADIAEVAFLREENNRLRAEIRRLQRRRRVGDPMLAGLDALDDELDAFYKAVHAPT
jgi:hypothetical protein